MGFSLQMLGLTCTAAIDGGREAKVIQRDRGPAMCDTITDWRTSCQEKMTTARAHSHVGSKAQHKQRAQEWRQRLGDLGLSTWQSLGLELQLCHESPQDPLCDACPRMSRAVLHAEECVARAVFSASTGLSFRTILDENS